MKKQQQKQKIYNLIILDESGSMNAIKDYIIRGFNEVVQTIRISEKEFENQEHYTSLFSFNGTGINTLLYNEMSDNLRELDCEKYQPKSMTPLYDAMGFSIEKLGNDLQNENDFHVLVTILTDGEENASREYTGISIAKRVEDLTKQGWTFTYIGANHNVARSATQIHIAHSLTFKADEAGVNDLFSHESRSRKRHYSRLSKREETNGDYFHDGDNS